MQEENTQGFKELQPGTTLCNGKYTIEKKIGEGGFGITYKAVQSGLNRIVCVKEYFLDGKCVRNTQAKTVHLQGITPQMFEKYRQAFVNEAKMLANLHHKNIVEVIDVFDENNTSYMVMSFIEGQTLQKLVQPDEMQAGKPLDYGTVVNYLGQIASAVGYIHSLNILHRDIKPDNILVTPDHHAILIDFGSAREFVNDKTQAHTSILTKCYAPPEQYNTVSRKGNYTDIYALGAVYYFAMTGKVPLEAATRNIEKMPEPKELNPAITDNANRTILKAMALKPENRHQNIDEFLDDLFGRRPSDPLPENDVVIIEKTHKWLWWVLGIAVVIIGGLILYLTLRPEKIVEVEKGKIVFDTEDFTGMNLYPMIKVEGGTFTMGSDEIDEDDCPPHTVTLDDYYIGQFEVSQGLWQKIMGSNPSEHQPEMNPISKQSYTQAQRDSFPVENVSYEEIEEFITRFNQQTGQQFSLPTEAQWEYAARGGNKSKGGKFANGLPFPKDVWFDKPAPLRISFNSVPNELGIYQMSGNVAEWCLDFYDENFYQQSDDSRNPVNTTADNNALRIVRGGSFNSADPKEVSIYYRDADNVSRDDIGFRLVIK